MSTWGSNLSSANSPNWFISDHDRRPIFNNSIDGFKLILNKPDIYISISLPGYEEQCLEIIRESVISFSSLKRFANAENYSETLRETKRSFRGDKL
jgi:hypothetical protein